MIDNLQLHFSEHMVNDEISVKDIDSLVVKYPFAGAYKLQAAFRMDKGLSHEVALHVSDRTYIHYTFEIGDIVPSIKDLKALAEKEKNTLKKNADEPDFTFNPETYIEESKIKMENIKVENINVENITTVDIESEELLIEEEKLTSDDLIVSDLYEGKKEERNRTKYKSANKKNKFILNEFSGISGFSRWLLSFKSIDLDKKIIKEEKAAKKKKLEENVRKSVTKMEGIMSEPLAEILASQGHLDEAKKMYEQLMIKYPEKSSYFAVKINNLIKI